MSRKARYSFEIHHSVKSVLGYPSDISDEEVLGDWKDRLRRVCKPCWELKYCPYGPFVEQSPLLPPLRDEKLSHIEYMKGCVSSGLLGELTKIGDEEREMYEKWLSDESILIKQSLHDIDQEKRVAIAAESDDPGEAFISLDGPLPPIQIYRIPYEIEFNEYSLEDLDENLQADVAKRVHQKRQNLTQALNTGIKDSREPLDIARKSWFERQINNFYPDDYPENIHQIFLDGSCNIFGHICPVFFTAEAITETSAERRRGRYIPFSVKVRVVRRDNYTCQKCGEHLKDDEVEFDHIIPLSKGGSSEEHNIRLTCFECNRSKGEVVEI